MVILQELKPSLTIKNLCINKSNLKILDSFSLKLFPGKITALVGWSGSGKSTAALALFNLKNSGLTLSYDEFFLSGEDASTFSETKWREIRGSKITMIPQNPAISFHPFISIENQFKEYYRNKKKILTLDQIIELICKYGIENPEYKVKLTPSALSGGEKQRLLIAMISGMDPEIIIADEPTTALDAINEKMSLKYLYNMVLEKNISLLLVSHDLRIVKNLADNVILLKDGQIMEEFTIMQKRIPKLNTEYAKNIFSSLKIPI